MGKFQTRIFIFLFSIVVLIFFLASTFVAGMFFERSRKRQETKVIDSQVIVDKINDSNFLVSRTVFMEQSVEIKIDKGSGWSNFWWGQTINAEALVRVDVGVDYQKINVDDIEINEQTKKIIIYSPDSEILDANVSGDISVKTKNGILKLLLSNDPNEDHNLATQELIDQAKIAVESDTKIMEEAKLESWKTLQLVLSDLGYEVEIRPQN